MNVPLYSILCVYKGLLSWASGGAATFSFMIGPGFYIILIMFVLSIYNYSVTRRRYPKIFVITTKRDKTSLYTQKPPKNFLNYMRSYYDIIPELHQKKIGWCPNTTMIYTAATLTSENVEIVHNPCLECLKKDHYILFLFYLTRKIEDLRLECMEIDDHSPCRRRLDIHLFLEGSLRLPCPRIEAQYTPVVHHTTDMNVARV